MRGRVFWVKALSPAPPHLKAFEKGIMVINLNDNPDRKFFGRLAYEYPFFQERCEDRVLLATATVAVRAGAATRAAEDKEKGYDNKPDPLVFEDIAKTVIHNKSSVVYCLKRLRSSISYYEGFRFLVTKFNT